MVERKKLNEVVEIVDALNAGHRVSISDAWAAVFPAAERETLRQLKHQAHYGGTPDERRTRALAVWDRLTSEQPDRKVASKAKAVQEETGVKPRTLRRYLQERLASSTGR